MLVFIDPGISMNQYQLEVTFSDECYQAVVDFDVCELWEYAEISYTELFEYVGVPYDPFDMWTVEELVDMVRFSCVKL
jgi:hypothetical protein